MILGQNSAKFVIPKALQSIAKAASLARRHLAGCVLGACCVGLATSRAK